MDDKRRGRLEPLTPGQLAALLLAILTLAVVVVAASRPGEAGPTSPPSSAETRAAVIRAAVILFAIGELALFGLVLWSRRPDGKRAALQLRKRRSLALAIVASFLQIAAALVLVWYYLNAHPGIGGSGGRLFANLGRPPDLSSLTGGRGIAGGQEWLTALIVLVVLAVMGGIVLRGVHLGRRRSPRARLTEQLEEAIDEGLEELEADTDPRRAVIAAYARMEWALARVGLPRAPHEAALEYLDRLLGMLDARGPAARRLTELFQVAKFSDHLVDAEMQREAIGALTELRDNLRARAAEREIDPRAVPA
jgi:Domain of unknown function (DUF4129)